MQGPIEGIGGIQQLDQFRRFRKQGSDRLLQVLRHFEQQRYLVGPADVEHYLDLKIITGLSRDLVRIADQDVGSVIGVEVTDIHAVMIHTIRKGDRVVAGKNESGEQS